MCKEVYRGEGIHVKMREVETYRKPSKTHTRAQTHTHTRNHNQARTSKTSWTRTLWLQALHLSLRKRRKRVCFFHFLFHDLTGATLTLSDLSGCLFVLWGIVLIVLCLTALIWAGMQPVTRDTPHHTQTHWKTSTVNTGTMCMGLPWVKRVKGVRATLWLG